MDSDTAPYDDWALPSDTESAPDVKPNMDLEPAFDDNQGTNLDSAERTSSENEEPMRLRCVNCGVDITHRRKHTLKLIEVLTIIRQWTAPQVVTAHSLVCHSCWTLATYNSREQPNVPSTSSGHRRELCVNCRRSIRRTRSHTLNTNSERETHVRNVISEWIAPQQVHGSDHICHPCWQRADRVPVPAPAVTIVPPSINLPNYTRAADTQANCFLPDCDSPEQLAVPTWLRKETTNRPSQAQLEGLVDFLEQNPGIAKGLLRTNQGKLETKRKWANLAISLKSLGGANKNGEGWAKYWAEKKCALKKQYAQLAASMRRTGGGTADNLPALSALENRLVAVMGGLQFAVGNPRLDVNPCPQSTRPTESFSITEAEEEHSHTIVPVQEDTEMHSSNIQVSPIPSTSHNDAVTAPSTIHARRTPLQNSIPPRPRRRRSSIQRPSNVNMEQLVAIEARRVEAELTTAQALSQLSGHIGNIASALSCIANAISDVARKMPNP